MNEILDKDGKPLSIEEMMEYEDDIWDAGVPMGPIAAEQLWLKWGERLGLARPAKDGKWLNTNE